MTRTVRLRAFAKLNLGLRVLQKRPDGYHELRTVFQTISLADSLGVTYTAARKTSVTVAGVDIPDNIIVRAAHRVMEVLGIQGNVAFDLKKNIPSGAGLGGGSSDAAAVLLALPVLAGKRIPGGTRAAVAAELGSDVPFFLMGGTALGVGRGEELYALPATRAQSVLLVAPSIHSSTVEAYRDLSKTLDPEQAPAKLRRFQEGVDRACSGGAISNSAFENDFEAPVFARYPELREIRDRLRRLGARNAAMTGSGSAIFGVFADASKREKAMHSFPNARCFAISFLSRARYQAAWTQALQLHTKGDEWPPQSLYAR